MFGCHDLFVHHSARLIERWAIAVSILYVYFIYYWSVRSEQEIKTYYVWCADPPPRLRPSSFMP